jgi:hypothetical protein
MNTKESHALIDAMTADEAKSALKTVLRGGVYVNGERWSEGFWTYRDHETGKLFSVPGFRPGASVVIGGFEGLSVVGVAGERDPVKRDHAQGGEIITTIDKMGDFDSMAEKIQGKRL